MGFIHGSGLKLVKALGFGKGYRMGKGESGVGQLNANIFTVLRND